MTITRIFFSFRFILIGAGIFVYFLWGQPILLEILQQVPGQPAIPVGLVLLMIQILNLAAILYKGPFIQQRIAGAPTAQRGTGQNPVGIALILVFLVTLCYVGLVSPVANWTVLEILGIEIRGTPPFWQGMFGFLYLFAMLVLNAGLMLASVFPSLGAIEMPKWLRLADSYPLATEWIVDIILAVFSVTTYTLIWEKLAASTPLIATTPQDVFMEYFGAVVFFCMVYPATNVLAVADDWLTERPKWARLLSFAIFVLIMLSAINSIPREV